MWRKLLTYFNEFCFKFEHSEQLCHSRLIAYSQMFNFARSPEKDIGEIPLGSHTHIHPFNGPLYRSFRVKRCQKW